MNTKIRLLACAATLLMAVCVMPKPAPTPTVPAIGCVSSNGGESCERDAYPACWEEDVTVGPCVWDARNQGNGDGISYFLEADGSVSLLHFP